MASVKPTTIRVDSLNLELEKGEVIEILDAICTYSKSLFDIDCSYRTSNLDNALTDTDVKVQLILTKDGIERTVTKSLLSCIEIGLCFDNIDELSKLEDCAKKINMINQTLKLLYK